MNRIVAYRMCQSVTTCDISQISTVIHCVVRMCGRCRCGIKPSYNGRIRQRRQLRGRVISRAPEMRPTVMRRHAATAVSHVPSMQRGWSNIRPRLHACHLIRFKHDLRFFHTKYGALRCVTVRLRAVTCGATQRRIVTQCNAWHPL